MQCNSRCVNNKMLDALNQLVIFCDLQLSFACINKAGRNLLGLPPSFDYTQQKLHLAQILQQDDLTFIEKTLEQLAQQQFPDWQGNLTISSLQGLLIPCHLYILPVFHKEKTLRGFNIIAKDLRHSKSLENHIKLSSRIFENTIEGIMIADGRARIKQVNTAFSEITGYSRQELIGQTPRLLRSEHHDDDFYAAMWKSIAEKDSWQGEIWNRRKNGSVYLQWMSMNALRNDQGEIENYFSIVHDLSELRAKEAQIQHLAQHDILTGLGNRHLLNQRLHQAVRQANSQANELALLLLDLGHIKILNETYGHTWCDKLIQTQSKKLEELTGETDTLVRIGADEFALLIEDPAAVENIAQITSDIFELLQQAVTIEGHRVTMSPSVGVAFYPADAEDEEGLLSSAQIALKDAKTLGRDNYSFFDPKKSQQAKEKLNLEQALRSAITGEGLSLNYQPKIQLADKKIYGVEALLRWHHEELGHISPGVFIPLAEQAGIINSLGTWVLEEACRALVRWRDEGLNLPNVAVNLAVQQLEIPNFAIWLEELLDSYGLTKDLFELEITETGMMENEQVALDTLNKLKDQGFRIALDDFGTGYSSLSYLRKLPISTLKIDRAFIQEMTEDDISLNIVKTLVQLAHNLKLDLVAEGIEEEQQAELLLELGCQIAQGFLFYRPLPEEELTKLLTE